MNDTCTRFIIAKFDTTFNNCDKKHTVYTDVLGTYKTKEAALQRIDSLIFNLSKAISSMFGYKTINLKISEDSVEYSYKMLELSCKDIYVIKEVEIDYDD